MEYSGPASSGVEESYGPAGATRKRDPAAVARDYDNSDDADSFYHSVWGGEDIHVGLYADEREDIVTGLADPIEVVDRSVGDLPFEDDDFGVVWSQDVMLHSGDRVRVPRRSRAC
ncbi:Glycine/sarcosine/dimethylglycine N-methyltransferase [Saccharomonospora xinjiangensis]|uniref:hypothetical protein n=1 Tax=Saccharomonospora xinjiangensis TaxID=75294 RepID=UPI0010C2D7A4|nr:Glycine/sarcosine/dimethylglycine N-methyltransferase [Saccharomonospora xinjiangensis]